jgi:hypothetical protein
LISIIKEFNIKNIDWLACDTLNYPNWVNFYNILKRETNIIIGASNNKTGNIKYGGDWLLESTSQNIERIYFTKSIEYYTYLFDDIQEWATLDTPFGVYIAINNEYLYIIHLDSPNITQINLNDPTDQTIIELDFTKGGFTFYNNDMYIMNNDNKNVEKLISLDPPQVETFVSGLSDYSFGAILYETYMYIATSQSIDRINLLNDPITIENKWSSIDNCINMFIYDGFLYVLRRPGDESTLLSKISLEDPTIELSLFETTTPEPFSSFIYILDNYIYFNDAFGKKIYKMDLTKTLEFVTLNNKPLTIEDDPDSQIISIWKETQNIPYNIIFDSTYVYVMEAVFATGKTTISRFDLPKPSIVIPLNDINTIVRALNRYNNLELSQTFQNSKKTRSTINLFVKAINLFA